MNLQFQNRLPATVPTIRRRQHKIYRPGTRAAERIIDGRAFIQFCSSDYLGLSQHPAVIEAAMTAMQEYSVGSGSASLIAGYSHIHHELSEALADWLQRERVLLFSNGYMANMALMAVLIKQRETVWHDRFNHASLLHGTQAAGGRIKRYPHRDTEQLQQRREASGITDALVVTDGIFSMEGDAAPLKALSELSNQQLVVDDAHGLGIMGPQGAGLVLDVGLSMHQVPALVGTFGKAFGTAGAFIAGSTQLIEAMIQSAPAYRYTTALPPALAAATLTSLKLIQSGAHLRTMLNARIAQFRTAVTQLGYSLKESTSPIQIILVGSDEDACALSTFLMKYGLWTVPIRPPTVPEGQARIRMTLSTTHTEDDLKQCIDALAAYRHTQDTEITQTV